MLLVVRGPTLTDLRRIGSRPGPETRQNVDMSGVLRPDSQRRGPLLVPRALPSGSVTFVFTDIEGSTRHLQELGDDDYARALEQHRAILTEAIAREGGVVVDTQGDGLFAVFGDAVAAVSMTVMAQLALLEHRWPGGRDVRTRMGLHTGQARYGTGGYVGLAVHQAARVASAAHGGQVIASSSTMDAIAGRDGMHWRTLGSHRLKDLGAPIEIYQLCHPRLQAEFPPLRSLESSTHNLPLQLSSFVGRDEELALGSKLLTTSRLLTVTGTGGIGKTRLALQLAAENIGTFPGGAFFVELAPLDDGYPLERAVMDVMGLVDESGRSGTESVVSFLEDRNALLLLDNCEHVVDAVGSLVTRVLSRCPGVHVLATSRTPLQLPGETVWTLGPLRLPGDAGGDPDFRGSTDAVSLFCERAAEARVGFSLSKENAGLVHEICARLDGLPLALELAAARVRTVPLAEIVRRVESGLDLLSKSTQASSPRQLSVRATLAWSHDLLSPEEQILFRRLAIFRGGFDLPAAETVCSDNTLDENSILDALEALIDKSLAEMRTNENEEGRYRLLEPVRAYAAERLAAAQEEELLADRHAAYFAHLLQESSNAGGTPVVPLEAELANFVAALDRLAASSDASAHGSAVCALWSLVGDRHFRLGQRELKRYFDRGEGEPLHRIRAARYYGNLSIYLAEHEEARRWYDEALRLARALGDRREIAICLRNCAQGAFRRECFPEGEGYISEALRIADELKDRLLRERCVGTLAMIEMGLGRPAEAAGHYAEAAATALELHDENFHLVWQSNLGEVLTDLGRYAEAEAQLRALCEQTVKPKTRWDATATLGEQALRRGNYREARRLLESVREQSEEVSYTHATCNATIALGELAVALGQYDEATRLLEEGRALAERIGAASLQTRATTSSARLALEEGDYSRSRRLLDEAAQHSTRSADRRWHGFAIGHFGVLAVRQGHFAEAKPLLDEVTRLAAEREDPGAEAGWRYEKADLLLRSGRSEEAAHEVARALELSTRIGETHGRYLEMASAVLVSLGREESAALALGAADSQDATVGRHRSQWERDRVTATAAACATALGRNELSSARMKGAELTWPAAVAETLEALASAVSALSNTETNPIRS